MVVMIVLAAFYAVAQLAAIGWWTRSVRWAVLVIAVCAGLWAAAPASIALQWAWTRAFAAVSGASLSRVTAVASYTVDPWLEEAIKVAPLLLIWRLAERARRQWGCTDIVLLCAAVGAGFGLAEQLLRFGDDAHRAIGPLWGGWTLPGGLFGVLVVPGPATMIGQWLPAGVQAEYLFAASAADRIAIHPVLSSVAGLGVALWLTASRASEVSSAASPWPSPARLRWAGAVAFALASLDHAAINAEVAGGLPATLATPLTAARPLAWAYPLVALGLAIALDRRVLGLARGRTPELTTAPTAGAEAAALGRIAWQQPRRSLPGVLAFVRLRRAYWTATLSGEATDDQTAALGTGLRTLAPALAPGAAPAPARGPAPTGAQSASSEPQPAGARPLRGRRVTALAWVVLALPSLVYFVVGGLPALSAVQKLFATSFGFWLVVATTVGGAAWTAWMLRAALVAMPSVLRHPLADHSARVILTSTARTGSLAITGLGWLLVARGGRAQDPIVVNYHILEAIGQTLLVAGLVLAVAAILMDPPLALALLVTIEGEVLPTLVVSALSPAAVTGLIAAGSGVVLMNAPDTGSGSGSGDGGSGPSPERERMLVDGQDELLAEADRAAGGSLDDLTQVKPGWWQGQRPDGTTVRIEWEPRGHPTTNEGPHVTVRVPKDPAIGPAAGGA